MKDTKNGEEDVIDCLYRLYEQRMFRWAYEILRDEYLAEDAVHEAFLRLIRRRDKIRDPASPEVRSYVYKTQRSAALDLYRRRKRHRDNCLDFDEEADKGYFEDYDSAGGEKNTLALMGELPEKYAAVMRCLFWDGLSIRETAAVLMLSEACVRKRCERARVMLRSIQAHQNDKHQKEIHYER